MAIAITGLVASTSSARNEIETPRYEVASTHDGFEVRRYAPRLVAEVEVTGSGRTASNAGFRLLADYIFGNNTSRGSIAMTAPVDRRRADADERWRITFTMPSKYTLETLPKPNDERVEIRRLPTTHFAAVRFSGAPNDATVQERMDALRRAVEAEGLELAATAPIYARYDPPWTLPMLRRNEILLELVVDAQS